MLDQQYHINGNTYVEFLEGLFVRVPKQDDGTEVVIERKEFGSVTEDDDFTVIRPLVNFFIKDLKDKAVETFEPPMQLLVRFTQNDLNKAADLEKELVFAYFNPALNEGKGAWVPLPRTGDTLIRHTFFDDFEGFYGFRGFDTITVKTWPGDPGSAWGV